MNLITITALLGFAIVAVILTRKAKLSSVLGYLAAGVAIGPWGLRLVTNADSVLHVAEFGIVLLLFVIGLELKPQRLWVMRRNVFGLGGAQVLVSSVALALAMIAAGIPWLTAVIVALGLSFCSTALVLQVLAERDELNTTVGRAAFSVALFQDLAAMPTLAVLPLLAAGQIATDSRPWLAGAKVVGLLVGAVLAGRYLLRPLLRLVAQTQVREAFTAAALLIVLGMASLADAIGLSMALGAFIAGVLLADSEYRHELEADIDPFRGLLLGLFFVGVGMTANLGLFAATPLRIVTGVLAMLAIKWLTSAITAKAFGNSTAHARRLGWVLAPGGEFAFVIFLAASGEGILPAGLRDQLMLIVTVSMVLGPFLIMLGDRLERYWEIQQPQREPDVVDDAPKVIIAGFGRFGQIIGRVLLTQRIAFTALEVSPAQVDFVRRFGSRIYYGDASRLDLLRAAGIERAQVLALAMDDVEASVRTAELVRRHFPQVRILARVRNRQHAYKMLDLGITCIVRETLHSSLELAGNVLASLGIEPAEARRRVAVFQAFDERKLQEQHAFHSDEPRLLQSARETARELEQLFDQDLREQQTTTDRR